MSAQEQSSREAIARKINAEYDAPFLTCIPFAGFPITATQQSRGPLSRIARSLRQKSGALLVEHAVSQKQPQFPGACSTSQTTNGVSL
jgi:hypothetical protein